MDQQGSYTQFDIDLRLMLLFSHGHRYCDRKEQVNGIQARSTWYSTKRMDELHCFQTAWYSVPFWKETVDKMLFYSLVQDKKGNSLHLKYTILILSVRIVQWVPCVREMFFIMLYTLWGH